MKLPRIPLRRQKLPKVVGKTVGSGTRGRHKRILENGVKWNKGPMQRWGTLSFNVCGSGEVSLEEGREDVARGEAVVEGVLDVRADVRDHAGGVGTHESLPGRSPDLSLLRCRAAEELVACVCVC